MNRDIISRAGSIALAITHLPLGWQVRPYDQLTEALGLRLVREEPFGALFASSVADEVAVYVDGDGKITSVNVGLFLHWVEDGIASEEDYLQLQSKLGQHFTYATDSISAVIGQSSQRYQLGDGEYPEDLGFEAERLVVWLRPPIKIALRSSEGDDMITSWSVDFLAVPNS